MSREFDDTTSDKLTGSVLGIGLPFTIAGWIYPHDLVTQGLWERFGFGDRYHSLFISGSGSGSIRLESMNVTMFFSAITTTNPVVNTWQHVCGIVAGTNDRRVYLDGGNKGTNTGSVTGFAANSLSIAHGDTSGRAYYDGLLAEWGMWDIALTDAEVLTLAKGYSPLFVARANLVRYYRFLTDEDISVFANKSALTPSGSPGTGAHPRIIMPRPRTGRFIAPVASTANKIKLDGAIGTATVVLMG